MTMGQLILNLVVTPYVSLLFCQRCVNGCTFFTKHPRLIVNPQMNSHLLAGTEDLVVLMLS